MNNEQLKINAVERFKEIFRHDIMSRSGAEGLFNWLEQSDFFTAPASTRFHGAFEGGLVVHSVSVYERLEWENPQTRAIAALLHDLCKVNFYKPKWNNVKVYCENGSKWDKGGKFEWEQHQGYEIDDQLPYGHGEKSVYLIRNHMGLTEEEALAIRWHMGGFDATVRGGETYGVNSTFERYPLAVQLHIADLKATYLDAV